MKTEIVEFKESHTRLILIFTGWSSGKEIADNIHIPGWDVAVVSDYNDFDFDETLLSKYYTVYLFAWSLGVSVAARVLNPEKITRAFAIAGSLNPIDDAEGIPTEIYHGTASTLSVRNLQKFHRRMCANSIEYVNFKDQHTHLYLEESIEHLREQLYNIEQLCKEKDSKKLPWIRSYISKDDKIFPSNNLEFSWRQNTEAEIVNLKCSHLPDMKEIIDSVISDTSKVSGKFSKAMVSYDTNAIAQFSAAIKLTKLMCDRHPRQGAKILEIGCGTGLFTHEYAPHLLPSEATFIDIVKTGPFAIAPKENYFQEDAETWIASRDQKWDVILSASAIQWFANIPAFFNNCAQRLEEGGLLVISTFLPGNMEELDSLRPSPLIYPTPGMLRKSLTPGFKNIEIVEDEIKVEFKSLREMLMHLKHTGVAGSAPSSGMNLRRMQHLRSLTYRPVYIVAEKKD